MRHFRARPPQLLFFEITMECNLRCAHCGVNAGRPLEAELSTAECMDVLEQVAQAGIGSVCFSGGEPLLRGDLFDLAAYARARGLVVEISTNGMLITPEIARRLGLLVDHVQVSLDGSTAEVHEVLRGHGSFEPAVRGIRTMRAAGIPFIIGCVVHKQNMHDIGNLAVLAGELGAESLRLIHFACAWLGVCRGGCPAANFARGEVLRPHVQCFLTPEEVSSGIPLVREVVAPR